MGGVHGFDDAAELLHEELQLVFVFVNVSCQQHGNLTGNDSEAVQLKSTTSNGCQDKSLPTSYLFEKGLQRIVARLLHLAIDVAAEFGHDIEQHPVVIHQTAAELGGVSGQHVEPGFFFF